MASSLSSSSSSSLVSSTSDKPATATATGPNANSAPAALPARPSNSRSTKRKGGAPNGSKNASNNLPPPPSSIMIAPPPRVALGAGGQNTSTAPQPGGESGNSGSSNTEGGLAGQTPGTATSGLASGAGHAQQRHPGPGRHIGQRSQHHSTSSGSSSVTSSAAAQLVHQEKDLRIAQLERELTVMETEFTRELDKLSKAESETATFWQAKHSRLQQQIAQSDMAVQLLRAEVELREAERAELRVGWEEMQRAALVRDEEVRALRSQVRGLKEWVSTSTRPDGLVASDEVFGDGMARLANGLQNWVIVHFRRVKLDPSRLSDAARDDLAHLVPTHKDLVHAAKLQMLQSAVARILVELVFESYYVGLPSDQAARLVEVESFLHKLAGTADAINQWRSLTLALVSKDADGQLAHNTAQLTDAVVARVNRLLGVMAAQQNDARDQALRQLVTSAVELARLLAVQKAVFRVFMPSVVPHQRLVFDAQTMDDVGGEEDVAQREIACVTFPGIIKRGDETGSQLQYTNVICKARVLCSAEHGAGRN